MTTQFKLQMLGFDVESMNAVLERLAAIGIVPQRLPIPAIQGLRVLLADPDGRRVELIASR